MRWAVDRLGSCWWFSCAGGRGAPGRARRRAGTDDTFPLGAGYGELYTLAVLPQSRGSGVGTALPDAVDAALADRAITNLTVALMAQNEAAIRLYRWRGLTPGELIMYRIGPQPDVATR